MPARVAFFGSPEFAVPSLEAALAHFDVALVVTQPPRPVGRGQRVERTPVHRVAEARGLPIVTYVRGERAALDARLSDLRLDVLVVVAFGHILRPATLAAAPRGAVNVHASLLPRWRGVAPIERAILAGDRITGTSLMVLDEGVDTGPVLARQAIDIGADDTRVTLTARLAHAGADLLATHLGDYVRGALAPLPQPETGATYAPRLAKAEGSIDWRRSAVELWNQVRGLAEWPGAYTTAGGALLKVHAARPVLSAAVAPPGTIVEADARSGVRVACGAGSLVLDVVQMAGKRRVAATALAAGRLLRPGLVLGSP
jgi:methionyl-tRNA formyltransferase